MIKQYSSDGHCAIMHKFHVQTQPFYFHCSKSSNISIVNLLSSVLHHSFLSLRKLLALQATFSLCRFMVPYSVHESNSKPRNQDLTCNHACICTHSHTTNTQAHNINANMQQQTIIRGCGYIHTDETSQALIYNNNNNKDHIVKLTITTDTLMQPSQTQYALSFCRAKEGPLFVCCYSLSLSSFKKKPVSFVTISCITEVSVPMQTCTDRRRVEVNSNNINVDFHYNIKKEAFFVCCGVLRIQSFLIIGSAM